MEPIVPEPAERIDRGGDAPRRGLLPVPLPWAVGATLLVGLAVGVVLGRSGGQDEEVARLVRELRGLQEQLAASSAEQSGLSREKLQDEAAEAGTSRVSAEVAQLQASLADQRRELDTMRQMVAETLSKLDPELEGSLLHYAQTNQQAVERLRGELGALEARLAERASDKEVERLAEELASVRTRLAELADAQPGEALADRLAALEQTVAERQADVAAAAKSAGETEDRLAQIAPLVDQLRRRLDEQAAQLAAVEGRLEGSATRTEVERLAAELASAHTRLAELGEAQPREALAERFAALERAVAERRESDAQLAELSERVRALEGAMEQMRQVAAGEGPAAAPWEAGLAALERELAARPSAEALARLADRVSEVQRQLAALRRASVSEAPAGAGSQDLGETLAALEARYTALARSLAEAKRRAATRFEALDVALAALRADLAGGDSGEAANLEARLDRLDQTVEVLKKQHPFAKFPGS